jgi:hypothetical protein
MASEATPLDPNGARGWRRGFDAIAEYFLQANPYPELSS